MNEQRIELLKLAEELSALRLAMVARRWGLDYKYRPGQTRIAAGNGRQSGQFADEGRGASRRAGNAAVANAARKVIPKIGAAIVANPEAAAALGSTTLPLLAGGVATSRAAGLASVLADGGGARPGSLHMTPMLGIPYRLDTVATAQDYDRSATERIRINEECEDQRQKDELECQTTSAMYGGRKGWYSRKASYAICMTQARLRFDQCRAEGGPEHITIPVFT
ncbi:MAG: hypothetical protein M3N05_09275, partial [Pseudomonadota bacterium]|nr:hypothetical protein [Pseudomonadota bacterium]